MVRTALTNISEESENPIFDLKDDTLLSDVGVDSLTSLMTASRFAEELEITTESTMFMEETTFADIKRFVLETTPSDTSDGPAQTTATVAETQSVHLSTPERHPEVTNPITTSAVVSRFNPGALTRRGLLVSSLLHSKGLGKVPSQQLTSRLSVSQWTTRLRL